MIKRNYSLTVITLTKNNHDELIKTFNSIKKQDFEEFIELLIIDGSNKENFLLNKLFINRQKVSIKNKIIINHINANKEEVFGIYPSMNYGINNSIGENIIFMNSGDEFFNKKSIYKLLKGIKSLKVKSCICFGQAEIKTKIGISWRVPGQKIKNINSWLKIMKPNHQSIIVSRFLAKKTLFKEDCPIIADHIWKKDILNLSEKFKYIDEPVSKFYIGGVSSSKPTFKHVKIQLKNKYISKFKKLLILIRFFIPKWSYKYLVFMQKLKLQFIETILLKLV